MTIRGEELSHWDLWFLVVMYELPDGKRDLVLTLKRHAQRDFGSHRDDVERKLCHLLDLETRLIVAKLAHADVLAEAPLGKRLSRRARDKVLNQHAGRHLSPAMINTPRKRLSERATRGHWERFPVDPRDYEPAFGHHLVRPTGYYDYRMTPVVAEMLDDKRDRLRASATSAAAQIAVDRLAMTLIVELMEHVDDHGDMGPIFDPALGAYAGEVWEAGLDPELVLRDGIEFGVWEDYGLSAGMEVFLAAVPAAHQDLAVQILAETRAELLINGLEYEHRNALSMWSTFLVAHERFDEFEFLVSRLGADASPLIATMADSAEAASRHAVADAVLAAAEQARGGRQRGDVRGDHAGAVATLKSKPPLRSS